MRQILMALLAAAIVLTIAPTARADHLLGQTHKEKVVVKKRPFGVKVVKPVKRFGFQNGPGIAVSPFGLKAVAPHPEIFEKTVIVKDAFGRPFKKIVLVDVDGHPVDTHGKIYPAGTFKPYKAAKPVYYERTIHFKDRYGQVHGKTFLVDVDGRPVGADVQLHARGPWAPYPYGD